MELHPVSDATTNAAHNPHADHDDIETNELQQQRVAHNSTVHFARECVEHDANGKCTKRRILTPKFANATLMMSRRRSSAEAHHRELLAISKVKQTGSVLSLLGPLLLALTALLIPSYCVPLIVEGMGVQDKNVMEPLATSCVAVLPALMFLKWCGYIMDKALDLGVSEEKDYTDLGCMSQLLPSVPLICISLAIVFRQARDFVSFEWESTSAYSNFYILLLDYGAAMSMFAAAVSGLDAAHQLALKYANKVDSIASNKNSAEWKSIMKGFRSFDDLVKDRASAIPGGHRSPAQVLSDIVGIYANVGKALSMTLLLLFFLDIDLSSNTVAILLTVTFAGIIRALDIQDATKNVLSLSVSNAVHVGEIISLARPGFTPADNPSTHIAGFLEGVTWGHVIIRDFRRKQCFISHAEFNQLVMQNWARRPNKHAHFIISVVPELSGGADRLAKLAKYSYEWIQKHPFIDQEGYQKSVIKWTEHGLVLEVIFYPSKGGSANQIRAEFVTMVLAAAKRLNLCLMPAEVRTTSSPWSVSPDSDDHIIESIDFTDLHPSPDLTERAGFKPKSA